MLSLLHRFAHDESGATAIEYALIAVLIAVGLIASATSLKDALIQIFNNIASALATAN
jgi:pilus assembly protein Flp/PilA